MRHGLAASLLLALPLAACKHAAPIHPRAVEHNSYCAKYIEQGELEKAETRCKLALEFNPDYPEPYNNLGLIELKRNHWDAAKDDFVKAIHLNQDFAEAHNNLGFIFLHQNSLGKAHDELLRALKVNPDYVEARYNLALAYMRMKNYPEARKSYEAIIESAPNVADPHHDLCAIDIDEGQLGAAVDECQQAIRLDPKYTSAYFNLGNAYMKAGKFCEAREAYTDCLRLDQDHAECRNNVTIANRKCALLDPALKEASSPVSSEDGQGEAGDALYKKGLAEVESGLVNEARRSFNKCVRKSPDYALCYYQLYKLDAAVDDGRAARDDCKKFLRISGEEASQERGECTAYLSTDGQ